ncbi:vitamin K-dependent gamma-carboxylase-like protein [Dyadobacter jejuensis]|uniref:Vitamin K-dependent gamma-carboxylase-like protein n=1 Tax=Dyadobacter jejuensis TaxID=1082580 RepID=A0A316AJK5_9BACT|nr:HTTM domain-containing protein [Dyadobacter jejuensis]PWJ58005.1 vitamin K-dependent gamma-carboxylase-like protein [Dyadobacter jejuensis]
MTIQNILQKGQKLVSSSSLAFFRIIFGLLMLASLLRFLSRGWLEKFYIQPEFYFSFYGFEWIKPLPDPYIYWVFYALIIAAVTITLGLFYRFSIIVFFLLFTYVELLDKSVYLNHYYQVSLLAWLMCWLPMNGTCSVDQYLFKKTRRPLTPLWMVWVLRLQVGSVYFFGGLAKLRYDWLFEAQPLKIWLAANSHIPVLGDFLGYTWLAFVLSWFALFFDLTAAFLLSNKSTRMYAYVLIVLFHVLTHILFQIGMFPWMMIVTALVFFPTHWHQKILAIFERNRTIHLSSSSVPSNHSLTIGVLALFFLFQLMMPFRSYAYPGNVLWHEQGFRFSWNIMLMEKNASLEYEVIFKNNGKKIYVRPEKHLNTIQAKQCSFQPDMILQFAHYLNQYYKDQGLGNTEVYAICYASVNGHASRLLIDPEVDLVTQKDGFADKKWILRYRD